MEASQQETTIASGTPSVEIPQTPATPAVETKTESAAPDTGAPAAEGKAPEVPAFTPNLKFKVMDKEHQVDEWLKPVIKDADTEKKIRELYEKAYGLDYVKPKYETAQKELERATTAYQSLYRDASEAMEFKNRGDLDSFFEKVSLSPEKVYQWVLSKIERQNLPPEQQQVYNELDQRKRAEYQQSRQIEEIENRYRSIATQAREAEVDSVLARPDVNQTVSAYDAKHGQGAFKAFVAEYGVMHFNVHGEDPSATMAVDAVMKRLGDAYRSQPAPTPQTTATGEKQLPVIPNVSGKNISPTKKAPRSIEDLRKLASDMTA